MELLLGHLIGDYLLQWDEMAMRKKEKSIIGLIYCLIHCFLYTIIVYLFVLDNIDWFIFLCIFLSHFLVDRYNWLLYLHKHIYKRPPVDKTVIGILVYITTDNTIHLVSMYFILKLF